MSERQQRLRLGLFVVASLGLLGGLVLFFGGAPDWFTKTNKYTIVFSDAPGIASGTPVRKSGVKVGEVHSIKLDDSTGSVRVVVWLNSDFTPRTSDEPTVTRGLIVGDTAIDFIPKLDKAQVGEAIPPNSVIDGASPFNAKVLIDQAVGVVPQVQQSLEQIRKSLEALEKMAPQAQTTLREVGELAKASREFIPELKRTNDGLRDVFSNPELGPALQNIVPELRKTNDEIRLFLKTATFWVEDFGVTFKKNEPKITKTIDALATTTERISEVFTPENQKSINEILKNTSLASARFDRLAMGAEDLMKDGKTTMKTLNSTLAQTEQTVMELRQATRPLSERAPKIMQNLETASDNFNKTMADARELIRAVGQADGTFQKFITDPSLYNNLNQATATINKLMPSIERIMKDVEVFADKLARHPELLGAGGLIRPSAGLKDAPSSMPNHRILKP
jgi:phospholipid/cholesterol/gamma-HCH transport system substrate-binding protein